MNTLTKCVLPTAAAILMTGAPAIAADLPSLKQLLALGYEIKAVTVVPQETIVALGWDPKNPQVIVTLQSGASLAACEYSALNWIGLAAASLEGTTQCDVYPK